MTQPSMPAQIHSLENTIRPTTLIQSPRLNARTGFDITIASETFQITGSFKFRAAYNLALNVQQNHIITASSGNFGQALAYACKLLAKKCTVVMPDNSASVKVEAVREYGGNVELVHTATTSRAQRVSELAAKNPDAFVASAYDDPFVIAGNATLGRELAALPIQFDAVLIPVGGGGLSAGVITGMRDGGRGSVPIYGVEPSIANDAARSLREGRIIANESEPQTIADGVRTVSVGKHNWAILQNGLAEVLEVSEESIKQAMRALFLLANLKVEPTGALSLAAACSRPDLFANKKICCVVSGGNVDPQVFQEIVFADAR